MVFTRTRLSRMIILVLAHFLLACKDWQSVTMRYVMLVGCHVVLYTNNPFQFLYYPMVGAYTSSKTMLICEAIVLLNVPIGCVCIVPFKWTHSLATGHLQGPGILAQCAYVTCIKHSLEHIYVVPGISK